MGGLAFKTQEFRMNEVRACQSSETDGPQNSKTKTKPDGVGGGRS